jgi:hypothetical protein
MEWWSILIVVVVGLFCLFGCINGIREWHQWEGISFGRSARNLIQSLVDSINSCRRRIRSDEESARRRWQWHRHLAAVSDFDQKRRVTTGWQGQRIRTDGLQGRQYSWAAIAGVSHELQSRRDPWLALIGIGKCARKVLCSIRNPNLTSSHSLALKLSVGVAIADCG